MTDESPEKAAQTADSILRADDSMATVAGALAIIESLRGGAALRLKYPDLRRIIGLLIDGVPFPAYPINGLPMFRGHISTSKKPFEAVRRFSYLPAQKVTGYGRCSRPGVARFYGASNVDTVLSELSPEIGEFVMVGCVSIKPQQSVLGIAIGELDHLRRFSRVAYGTPQTADMINAALASMSPEQRVRAWLVDAYLVDLFSQQAWKSRDYKLTCALSEELSNDEGDLKVEILAYPSVAHRGGTNFSVKPEIFDEKFKWDHFMAFEVQDYLGFGIFGRTQYAKSAEARQSGKIKWEMMAVPPLA